MSDLRNSAHKVPIPTATTTTTSTRAITPPKRFLDFSSVTSPRKYSSLPSLVPSSLSASYNPTYVKEHPVKPKLAAQEFSPPLPKLVRIPRVVSSQVDASPTSEEGVLKSPSPAIEKQLPTSPIPPPLIRMPISTRKEKRSLATALGVESKVEDDVEKVKTVAEPPKKRARTTDTTDNKAGERCAGTSPTTPRKIIQEIFGTDKSKRSKGKGRKKKRPAATPKKKNLPGPVKSEVTTESQNEGVSEKCVVEEAEASIGSEIGDHDEKDDDSDGEVEALIKHGEKQIDEMPQEEQEDSMPNDLMEDEVTENAEDDSVSNEKEGDKKDEKSDEESEQEDEEEETTLLATVEKSESSDKLIESSDKQAVSSVLLWETSKRKAKQVATERLKRMSQCEQTNEAAENNDRTEESENAESQVELSCDSEVIGTAGSVQSRRSTTEGSSKSGSSTAPGDSESSNGCVGGGSYSNKHLLSVDRQRFNPTPLSLISEDDYNDGKEPQDGVSVSDLQEQKDSDVDSTYSWKPVRAAAAAALEQVTKKQGSGSTGLPGDAEAKAAAAAERRARKIMRHKGRSRRTLQFKNSHSKEFTKRKNTIEIGHLAIPGVVYDHGYYFQAGDIVTVELADGSPMYGQIKGLLVDHKGETSAGIMWLSPKHPLFAQIEFHPRNYSIRYDLPERLIKIEYVNFVMHLNVDYFHGHPSYPKLQKNTVYTRMGRYLYQNQYGLDDSDSSDESCSSQSSACSRSSTKSKSKESNENESEEEKGNVDQEQRKNDNDNSSVYSTDIEEVQEKQRKENESDSENSDSCSGNENEKSGEEDEESESETCELAEPASTSGEIDVPRPASSENLQCDEDIDNLETVADQDMLDSVEKSPSSIPATSEDN